MKLTSSTFVAACIGVIANAIYVVQAETMLRIQFNNGISDPSLSCSATDNVLISKVFQGPLNRRNLRSSETVDQSVDITINFIQELEQSNDNNGDRELASASYCADQCVRKAYCFAFGCLGYGSTKRRQLQNYGKGYLSNSTYCRTTADSVNSDLNYLVSQNMVSSSCIALLKAPRIVECYEDVMFGIIEKFSIIDAGTDTALIPFLHARQEICGMKPLNIEVFVNP